mmetsp:Transcript_19285/g.23024  ORF Transcript_19285/g.23024 Transcript_19285/m.23024 type:complete len:274 (-) Transcript_19285:168-989(-)|eukprot:CAMPEP_0197851594 /NCGR_PEP_ID=MMETSP1438-20131217/18421_1 /TAXON_ID=1461541 /ORGANISM="Pterosperma sp., Strain CCMP1384" /LENGTH=273 /DNA_ID=CAMNT_0043465245 /DNA_START=197 /DNA_END=1018 /DNA_ORIENTATION=-
MIALGYSAQAQGVVPTPRSRHALRTYSVRSLRIHDTQSTKRFVLDRNLPKLTHHQSLKLVCQSKSRSVSDGSEDGNPSGTNTGAALATQFSKIVNTLDLKSPAAVVRPSALLPPTAVVEAQMDALQRCDYPEDNSGVKTAYAFALPHEAEGLLVGGSHSSVHAWTGSEQYVPMEGFSKVFDSTPYASLLHCEGWTPASPMKFMGSGQDGDSRAVQAVSIQAIDPSCVVEADICRKQGRLRNYKFTFCLRKVKSGPYKDCWMTVGVRSGDYANV